MIERWTTDEAHDAFDARVVTGATGLLADFNRAGLLTAADVHVAARTAALAGEDADDVRLAVALAVRAARQGSVCVDLAEIAAQDPELGWPAVDGWAGRVAASRLAASSVVRVDGELLYLDRYHREETQVCEDLVSRLATPPPEVDDAGLATGAERLFPGERYAEQRAAAVAAARRWTTVLTGGPGTGKTTTVAGLLALLGPAGRGERSVRVALAAPTGKAAARLQEAVLESAQDRKRFTDADREFLGGLTASTLHRLLGWRPGSSTRFRHHRGNKLPHDVIVVDESSMVSLTMMARLLEAVRPDTRLVLVGDPDQLASVEAGAVLSDLVHGLERRADAVDGTAVATLRIPHRFGGAIGRLADALRRGDADAALAEFDAGDPAVTLVDAADAMAVLRAELTEHAVALRERALAGDAGGALAVADRHRLLCAHRDGPWGAAHWNRQVERWLGEATGAPVGASWGHDWYPGRPILVTANDYGLGLFNGDTGVVVERAGELRAAVAGAPEPSYAVSRLADIETLHAMTVHKSQGSQARAVTVLLPPEDSPLLVRELFYTAVTRAQDSVRIVGTREAVAAAVTRRAQRASGLQPRLAAG